MISTATSGASSTRSEKAEGLGADVAVFPELVVTGYPPEDLLLEPDFVAASEGALAAVAARSGGCAAVVGYVAESGGLRNAAAVCRTGAVRGVAVKELLPNYGVFDEQRWFVPGAGDSPVFGIGGGTGRGDRLRGRLGFGPGPVARLAGAGAGIVLSLNASPFRAGARGERRQMLAQRAAESGCAIAYVNLVGGQDELVFDGGSMVVVRRTGRSPPRRPSSGRTSSCVDVPYVPTRVVASRRRTSSR